MRYLNILQELLQLTSIFVKMRYILISIKDGESHGIAKRVARA